jgi:hypothetical protein
MTICLGTHSTATLKNGYQHKGLDFRAQYNISLLLCWHNDEFYFAECQFEKCHYEEYHYANCH